MAKVFISYRREDARYAAKEMLRALSPYVRNPKADIFLDIDSIPRGVDYVEFLDGKVAQCEVLLALIGEGWLEARDGDGNRRLDDPEDFVRIEIAAALRRGIPVVPILLDGTVMPSAKALPDDLKLLARRQGEEVRIKSFSSDVDRLVKGLPIVLKPLPTPIRQTMPAPRRKQTFWNSDWHLWAAMCVMALGAVTLVGLIAMNLLPLSSQASARVGETAKLEQSEALAIPAPAVAEPAAEPLQGAVTAESAIRELQTSLKTLGYYKSSVDGSAGAGTQRAAEAFARLQGIPAPDLAKVDLPALQVFSARAAEAAKLKLEADRKAADDYASGYAADRGGKFVEARLLYQKACDGGAAAACNNLGIIYASGKGVAQDYAEARRLFQKACDGGALTGCGNLGDFFLSGLGVSQDYTEAFRLHTKACNGGIKTSCSSLGYLYNAGLGVSRDFKESVRLYKQACDGGVSYGCYGLGVQYASGQGVDLDVLEASRLYQKACDGGSFNGCDSMGDLYAKGQGVAQDHVAAARLYKLSCDGGLALGCHHLGFLYAKGEGVELDMIEAKRLYNKACDGGEQGSCYALKAIP